MKKPIKPNDKLSLLEARLFGPSAGILAQESAGQRSLVDSDTLPTDMGRGDTKAALEAAGVKFLGIVKDDPMFQYVELPTGWKKVTTNHSMWTDLVDDRGRRRAAIFYKAVSYDRKAHIRAVHLYDFRTNYDRADTESVAVTEVVKGNEIIYTTNPIPFNGDDDRYDAIDQADNLAKTWLDAYFPDWKSPLAYWND